MGGSTNIQTGGGAYVAGNASAGRDFIGRDQLNFQVVLGQLDNAAQAVSELMRLQGPGGIVTPGIAADLTALVEELRRTHASFVKLVSPLRRMDDNPATFVQNFRLYYADFRDIFDSKDFINERTHCSKIGQIAQRLSRQQVPIVNSPQWQQLQGHLRSLAGYDMDVIEALYVPYLGHLNEALKEMDRLVTAGDVPAAIGLRRTLLSTLEPQFNEVKNKLREMNDTVNTLLAML